MSASLPCFAHPARLAARLLTAAHRAGMTPDTAGEADEMNTATPRQSSAGTVWRYLLAVLLLALVSATVGVFLQVNRDAVRDQRLLEVLDAQQLLSQTVAKEAAAAARGDESAFERLQGAATRFDETLRTARDGDPLVPALPALAPVQDAYRELDAGWRRVRENIDTLIASREALAALREAGQRYAALRPALAGHVDVILTALADAYAGPEQLLWAARMSAPVERIGDGLARTVTGGAEGADAAQRFRSDAAQVRNLVNGFLNGEPALGIEQAEDPTVRRALAELASAFQPVEALLDDAYEQSAGLLRLQQASDAVLDDDAAALQRVRDLRAAYLAAAAARLLSNPIGVALAGAALLVLLVLVVSMNREARRRAEQERRAALEARQREADASRVNSANQAAIVRLLDEISDLADGDLTISASVTEDFTGAIADAINFAVEALRDTVGRINQTAVVMADAAQHSREDAERLARASATQAGQSEAANTTIAALAEAARTVAANAERGRQVASQSVQHANEGAAAARATIDGMDAIREHIQDTAKRIKRLGESSQEIGDIVGVIEDLADQTNILALNAAIQASMAGEQGRGFAVVADEVQRLAERAGQATRQIEGLVKAIQSDTNEAVGSMEQSTAGVVQGAQLAEEAGQALLRIERVSLELAGLVSDISAAAAAQTGQAGEAAQLMQGIQHITADTRSASATTAAAIDALARQAAELRGSVANFRLPTPPAPADVAPT